MKTGFQFFSNWGIAAKLVALFVVFGLIPMAAVGWIAFSAANGLVGLLVLALVIWAWTRFRDVPAVKWLADELLAPLLARQPASLDAKAAPLPV